MRRHGRFVKGKKKPGVLGDFFRMLFPKGEERKRVLEEVGKMNVPDPDLGINPEQSLRMLMLKGKEDKKKKAK